VKDARQMFLGLWIKCALSGQPFEVWGDGSQLRDLSFVDNVVDALIATAELDTYGMVFNLGGEVAISLRDLAVRVTELCEGASFSIKEFPAARRAIDIGNYRADDTAFRSATGWTPRVGFDQGLERTIDFYRQNRDRYF
jgi:UDP-glucose 4-epimerase